MKKLLTISTIGALAISLASVTSAATARTRTPTPPAPPGGGERPTTMAATASSAERLPFAVVNQLLTEIVHRFAQGPECDGAGDAGGYVNVIHRTPEGPRFFKAWILGDRFVVARYRERPQSEPPAERPAVAWMGEITDDGRLHVRATVDGGVFGEACAWLLGRDV
jgi:hypothetical protein